MTADYLSKEKTPEAMGLSDAPCPDGSSIESAIQPRPSRSTALRVPPSPSSRRTAARTVTASTSTARPSTSWCPSSGTGQRLADYLYAHHAELDLFDIIWSQHIWTIERSGEGFRSMEDRGSSTANHYDHVHVKIN